MYKEPFASKEINETMRLRIAEKMKKMTDKIPDSEQNDPKFTANLLSLCVLNRMAESHDK